MAKTPATSSVIRIEQTLVLGRAPQALDLAKQYALQHPGPDAQALLRRCYLAAAEYHVGRDASRDAQAILNEAETLPFAQAEWWLRLAELRADLGDLTRAMRLATKSNDPSATAKVLGRLADRAMREPLEQAKKLLPEEHHAALLAIHQAFAAYEQKQDDAAREFLNGIGLTSPFLEWKLLLRGLLAWSNNEDAKANENWSRLNPTRYAAKLVAPLRVGIDKAYATALPPTQYATIQRQVEGAGTTLGSNLLRLRKLLAGDETYGQALELARTLVPEIKKIHPDVVPRLANIFYWTLLTCGQPSDMNRYARIFGPHPDDPDFYRLQAMVYENIGQLNMAHSWWAKYEAWIAATPQRWPGTQAAHARALILERMGDLVRDWVESICDQDSFNDLVASFAAFGGVEGVKKAQLRPALHPSATECFRRASELAPERIAPALKLLEEYDLSTSKQQALDDLDRLLARFPNNLQVLEMAFGIYDELGDARATACIRQALALNPLDRKLQNQVALVTLNQVRRELVAGAIDAARIGLAEVKPYGNAVLTPAFLALQIALEAKVGNTVALQPLVAELFATPGMRIAGAYRLMVEMSRVKLPKKQFATYANAFADALQDATPPELAQLYIALEMYRQEPKPYFGMKSHEKKILDCMMRTAKMLPNKDDQIQYGLFLYRARLWKALRELAMTASNRQYSDLHFTFFRVEADVLSKRTPRVGWHHAQQYQQVQAALDKIPDQRYDQLRELLQQRLREMPEIQEMMNPQHPFHW